MITSILTFRRCTIAFVIFFCSNCSFVYIYLETRLLFSRRQTTKECYVRVTLTLVLDLDLDFLKMYVRTKMKFVGQLRLSKVRAEQDRQKQLNALPGHIGGWQQYFVKTKNIAVFRAGEKGRRRWHRPKALRCHKCSVLQVYRQSKVHRRRSVW